MINDNSSQSKGTILSVNIINFTTNLPEMLEVIGCPTHCYLNVIYLKKNACPNDRILNNWIFLIVRLTLESLCTSTNSFLRTDRYCVVPHPDRYLNITEASSSPPHISWNFFIVMIHDEFQWLSDRCLTTSAALSYIWRNRNVNRGIELKASSIPKQRKSWPKSCKLN